MLPHSLLLRARCPVGCILGTLGQQVRLSVDYSNSYSTHDVFSPEKVLSKESQDECIRRLQRMPSLQPPTEPSSKKAAVLVPLCVVEGEVSLLFTLRSPFMSSHRGQVSFPGGMKDDLDPSFESTALRETEEELGIPSEQVQIWGRCNSMESRNKVIAVPVIGSLGVINVRKLKFNPHEVGEVFSMSLRELCDKKNFRYTQFRTGKGYAIPVFFGGKHRIWGLTAGITHIFLTALLPSVYKNRLQYIRPIKT